MCRLSDCCGAAEWMEGTGLCGDCKEHTEFYDDEDLTTEK
jgi:hypothetical protein